MFEKGDAFIIGRDLFKQLNISISISTLFNAEDPLEHDSDPLTHAIDSEIPDPNAETIREAILPEIRDQQRFKWTML